MGALQHFSLPGNLWILGIPGISTPFSQSDKFLFSANGSVLSAYGSSKVFGDEANVIGFCFRTMGRTLTSILVSCYFGVDRRHQLAALNFTIIFTTLLFLGMLGK